MANSDNVSEFESDPLSLVFSDRPRLDLPHQAVEALDRYIEGPGRLARHDGYVVEESLSLSLAWARRRQLSHSCSRAFCTRGNEMRPQCLVVAKVEGKEPDVEWDLTSETRGSRGTRMPTPSYSVCRMKRNVGRYPGR